MRGTKIIMKESNFKFKNPQLKKFVFEMNDRFNFDKFDGFPIQSNSDIKEDAVGMTALVTLTLKIGEKSTDYPFYSEIIMSSVFRWNENTKNVEVLLQENAPALLLSYMRPIISNAVNNARLPAFDLPFMNFKESK